MDITEFQQAIRTYDSMSALVKAHSRDEIADAAAQTLGIPRQQLEGHPMGGYSKGATSGVYHFVLEDIKKNIAQYDWVYSRLADDASRIVFANLFGYRILPAKSFLRAAYDAETPQYFDKNIVQCGMDEVFVDCGGFVGDTTESFIREYGAYAYRKIYVYEPSGDNIQACRKNLEPYHDVVVRPCGVGETHQFLSIYASGSSSTFMEGAQTEGDDQIEIVNLDDDIPERVTFIKMDIEGSEIQALLGAKRHIREDFPKLAVCTYHVISDMWEIPRLIDALHPGYRFYFRHYAFPQNWETVCYAIPPKPIASGQAKARRRVVAMVEGNAWSNAQLVKDCGLIPYLMMKDHGCETILLGGPSEEPQPLSNLRYVEGIQMVTLPSADKQLQYDYLREHGAEIDVLVLYGAYPLYQPMSAVYKAVNPAGKIYLALDANSSWMDRIQIKDPAFAAMMSRCDVIAASGRCMQRHLNEKWAWPIAYLPNGFYNFTAHPWDTAFDKKENVILTVGRLGTAQKRTDVLLEAFAQVASEIPDWELRLAGTVDPSFESFLEEYRSKHPELLPRIHFLGSVTDRDALYEEYLRAKIFALPSAFEGGTPNVIAEALTAGDVIAISKIDEYQDATDHGLCGMAAEIGDTDGFAKVLLDLCRSPKLSELSQNARRNAAENFDMQKNVARLWAMLFGEEKSNG